MINSPRTVRMRYAQFMTLGAILLLAIPANGDLADGQPAPVSIDPADVIEKVIAKYKTLQTYKAEGTITADIDSAHAKVNLSTSFSILLKKPNMYLITWTQTNSGVPGMGQSGAAWSDGTQPYLYLGAMNAYSPMAGDEVALGGATGVSGGAAHTIPLLMLSSLAQMPSPFARLKNPTIEKTESVSDEPCYVISGSSVVSKKETYWVSKSSHLILKYARSLESPAADQAIPELTDKQLEEAAKGMGLEVTEESKQKVKEMMTSSRTMLQNAQIKGTTTELHRQISSPDLNKDNFTFAPPETAQLKASLFGDMFNQPAKAATP